METLVSQAVRLVAENQNTGDVTDSLKENFGSLADLDRLGLDCKAEDNDIKGTLENKGSGTPVEPPCGCTSEIQQVLAELAEDGAPVDNHFVHAGSYNVNGGCYPTGYFPLS